jgi:hypothetical protein
LYSPGIRELRDSRILGGAEDIKKSRSSFQKSPALSVAYSTGLPSTSTYYLLPGRAKSASPIGTTGNLRAVFAGQLPRLSKTHFAERAIDRTSAYAGACKPVTIAAIPPTNMNPPRTNRRATKPIKGLSTKDEAKDDAQDA